MGDNAENRTTELRREADELLAQAEARLEQARRLDSTNRQGKHRRQVDSLGRRWYGHLWVVPALGAVLAWAWHAVRRPSVALAAGGSGAAGVGALALPGLLAAPPPLPPQPSPAPLVIYEPEPVAPVVVELEQEIREVARVVEQPDTPDAPPPEPRPAPTYATADPEPSQPPQTAKPEPEQTKTLTPTPTPTVDVDLTPEELCLEVGLPATAGVAACVEHAAKVGLDVDLDLSPLGR